MSVDFGIDVNSQPWIIEVNGKPQKTLMERLGDEQTTALLYKRPLEYAYYLSQLT